MHRLFVAIRPPATIRSALIGLMEGIRGARWQDDEQLHLTLRFIGEVDGRTAEDVAAALGGVRQPPFAVALDGVGQFGSRGRPNALWAGVRPHDSLAHLHRKVDQTLVRAGLDPEGRAYLPHITLARFGRESGGLDAFLARHAGLSSAPFEVTGFALYESRLGHAGATYTMVERYDLRD
ncbi:RNA 2',3'-cyclic phosphodiesterase [Sphingomonas sp. MAH-20]|jgi:2'-5' RNA ligase|uniref:RNA 2',3'-cyclic phosphodiesterase n=1 Tax=Sphingomonas horti TaxID=2682842 RepID=A0A6I4J0F6_9SPHN|nr:MULTISPECIES: RNA 2',3'-cyclic phosphodiesterase [Sphingomonas]MBA2919811.1 RNA 2',3'-cyclic phosphodiesterase [Sphingomonas sp. CGMCC 1.13658]MVO78052.1 RNA 2',3'-cyclic phosphodiesterase [Sphingomonas horti]